MITELVPAGAERIVYELATRLDKDRFDIEVVALRGGAMADELRQAGMAVHVLGLRNKFSILNPLYFLRLRKIFRQGDFDIIHTHLFHADFAARFAKPSRTVLVHSVHIAEKRFRPWQFWFARIFQRICSCIITVSKAAMEHYKKRTHLKDDSYQVIYNGIDINKFTADLAGRQKARRDLNIDDNELLFLFAGRIDHQKGVDILLDSFEAAGPELGNFKLVIAGQGPQESMLQARLKQSRLKNNIEFIGFQKDVASLMNAADVLVMPSRWEGFGLSAVEAMATGLPVVAARVEGLTEIIVDRETGLLVTPENPKAFAKAIKKLAADATLRKLMGEAGRKRAESEFAVEKMVAAHEELYQGLFQTDISP